MHPTRASQCHSGCSLHRRCGTGPNGSLAARRRCPELGPPAPRAAAQSSADAPIASGAPQQAAQQSQQQQQQQQQQQAGAPQTGARRPRLVRRTSPEAGGGAGEIITFAEVQAAAAAKGLCILRKTLGPFYRITCREGGEEGKVLGVTAGFVAPLFGLVHCDTLQIFTRGMKGDEGIRIRGGAGLGVALLLGGAVFSHAWEAGCKKAEILAINDDDAWHERLVRYYGFFGFERATSVGGNGFFADLPHLLVWGGEGTRMDADVAAMLRKWGPSIRRAARGGAGAA